MQRLCRLGPSGREANEAALGAWLAAAQGRGLLGAGEPAAMASQFLDALWGGLLVQLLLRVRDAPTAEETEQRAQAATAALLHRPPQADEGAR